MTDDFPDYPSWPLKDERIHPVRQLVLKGLPVTGPFHMGRLALPLPGFTPIAAAVLKVQQFPRHGWRIAVTDAHDIVHGATDWYDLVLPVMWNDDLHFIVHSGPTESVFQLALVGGPGSAPTVPNSRFIVLSRDGLTVPWPGASIVTQAADPELYAETAAFVAKYI